MEKSLFPQWVDRLFKVFAQKIVEKLNGTKEPLTYLHRTMLRKTFSPTLKWGSLSSSNTVVSADVVAMDSSLPLKKRDSIRKADGDIPKLGLKLYLNETTMNELNILLATGGQDQEILRKLFNDTNKVVSGVWERLEYMFQEALSTGLILITDEDNPGIGIRVDFGHPSSNKYGVVTPWSDANAKPIDDIERIIEAGRVDGNKLSYILMDRQTFNKFKANTQVKEQYAFYMNFVGTNIPPVQSVEKANEFLSASHGVTIQLIDRNVLVEKDGKRKSVKPWADNAVVFLTELNVGTLTYGRLAEETFPAKQVDYAKVDDFILVSKYSTNDPIKEYTSAQALVLPVIDNIDSIYIMNCEEATAALDAQTEGDAVYTYKEVDYTKTSVIDAINLATGKTTAKSTNTDATLAKYIDQLNEEQILVFEANLTEAP